MNVLDDGLAKHIIASYAGMLAITGCSGPLTVRLRISRS